MSGATLMVFPQVGINLAWVVAQRDREEQ